MTEKKRESAQIEGPSSDDLARYRLILHDIGGSNVSWGAVDSFNIWLAEARLEAERLASRRLLTATWVLAAATVGLVAATIGLIVAGA